MTMPKDQRDERTESAPPPVAEDESFVPSLGEHEGWIADSSGDDGSDETLIPTASWGLTAVAAAILVALAGLGLGLIFLRLAVGNEGVVSALAFNVSLMLIVVMMFSTAWFFGPAMHGGGARSLGLIPSQTSRSMSWLLPPAVLVAVLLFNAAYVSVVTQLGIDFLKPQELPFHDYSPPALAITGVMVILAGPFAEEVFFRGFVLSGLTRRWGPVVGLLVSAAIFSLAHASMAIIIPIFVAGALLGWLYLRTGSLWSCVWVHGAQNAVAFAAVLLI